MTVARLIMPEDAFDVLNIAREHAEEARPDMRFSPKRAQQMIERSLHTGDPTIFVAERDGKLLGYLGARIYDYFFTGGFFVAQEVFYVRSQHRGSRAATVLIQEYLAWGKRMDAREYHFDISHPKTAERAVQLIGKFGGVPNGTNIVIKPEAAFDG